MNDEEKIKPEIVVDEDGTTKLVYQKEVIVDRQELLDKKTSELESKKGLRGEFQVRINGLDEEILSLESDIETLTVSVNE